MNYTHMLQYPAYPAFTAFTQTSLILCNNTIASEILKQTDKKVRKGLRKPINTWVSMIVTFGEQESNSLQSGQQCVKWFVSENMNQAQKWQEYQHLNPHYFRCVLICIVFLIL